MRSLEQECWSCMASSPHCSPQQPPLPVSMLSKPSYGWGWAVDKTRPDAGDFVWGAVALAGVAIAWFWPR
jgi:hypothetical protein